MWLGLIFLAAVAVLFTILVITEIATGSLKDGKMWDASRKDRPFAFWFGVAIHIFMALVAWSFFYWDFYMEGRQLLFGP